MNSKVFLLVAAFLSVSLVTPVVADSFYYRSKGNIPVHVGGPGDPGNSNPPPNPADSPLVLSASGIPALLEAENDVDYSDASISVSGGSETYVSAAIINQGDLGFSASVSGNVITISGRKDIGLIASKTYPGIQISVTDSKGKVVTGSPFDLEVKTHKSIENNYPIVCLKGGAGTALGSASVPFPCANEYPSQTVVSEAEHVEVAFEKPVQFESVISWGCRMGYGGATYDYYYFDGSQWRGISLNHNSTVLTLSSPGFVAQRLIFKVRVGGYQGGGCGLPNFFGR